MDFLPSLPFHWMERIVELAGVDYVLMRLPSRSVRLYSSTLLHRFGGSEVQFLHNFQDVLALFQTEGQLRLETQVQQLLQTGQGFTLEVPLVAPDRWVKVTGEVCADTAGQVDGLLLTMSEVTEQRQAQRVALDLNHYWRVLFQHLDCLVLHLSPELTICYANAYLETVLGYSAAAVLGHSFLDFVSPAEQNLARTALQTSEGDPDCAIEIHCQHRQGATVVLELTSVALPRSSPVKGWIVTARDVTPRHATVAALKSSEQRFRSLVAHLPDAVFRLTADRTACFVSRRIEAMTGYRESELLGNTPAWRDLCHPHDRTRLEQTLRELTPQSPGYAVEYRVLHSYQPPRWVVEQGSGRFVAGRLVGYDGILIDRHEQKMADVQLAAILEVLPDGILVVNHRAKVVKYNQTFLRLWGIPEAILQAGSDWEMIEWLLHRLTDADACQLLEQTAAEYLQPQLVQAARLTLKNGAVVERHSRPYALDGVMVGRVMTFRLL